MTGPERDTTPAAAVDIGTNSTLLVIARSRGGAPVVLEDLVRMPRLGQGVGRTGRLLPEAVERTLAVLEEFAARMDAHDVPAARRRVVSTAVLRAAAQTDVELFRAALSRRTGLALEVLDGEEEARLGWVAALGDGAAPDALLVDVGGGSSELVFDGGRARRSLPIGAVVLSERFGADLDALRAHAAEVCLGFPAGIGAGADVVALGGSGVNLAALELGLARFDPERTEGVRIATEATERWAMALSAMSAGELAALPIEPERARILPAGLLVLGAVLSRIGASGARVSGRGIRYGVLAELLGARKA